MTIMSFKVPHFLVLRFLTNIDEKVTFLGIYL